MQAVPDQKEAAHSEAVKAMFSGIRRYDLLKYVLSLTLTRAGVAAFDRSCKTFSPILTLSFST
jgi:hypothetical protein